MNKRQIYSQKKVVKKYNQWRFGGKSGQFVNLKELNIVKDLLNDFNGRILDMPCGTGRLAKFLLEKNPALDIVGADYSFEMLKLCQKVGYSQLVKTDAFHSSFYDNSFDCLISFRFVFHYQDIGLFFKEVTRLLSPNGFFIFDTYSWSPYQILGFLSKKYRKKVFIHSTKELREIFKKAGLEIVTIKYCFLFTPLLYRFLPLLIVLIFDKIEKIVPKKLLVRSIYKVKKITNDKNN